MNHRFRRFPAGALAAAMLASALPDKSAGTVGLSAVAVAARRTALTK